MFLERCSLNTARRTFYGMCSCAWSISEVYLGYVSLSSSGVLPSCDFLIAPHLKFSLFLPPTLPPSFHIPLCSLLSSLSRCPPLPSLSLFETLPLLSVPRCLTDVSLALSLHELPPPCCSLVPLGGFPDEHFDQGPPPDVGFLPVRGLPGWPFCSSGRDGGRKGGIERQIGMGLRGESGQKRE